MFELTNSRDVSLKTQAGVLECTAVEGMVHLPHWVRLVAFNAVFLSSRTDR
jgi:hypothetical protein